MKKPEHYQDFMFFTGVTDQHLGRCYKCPKCGRYYWSAWGWARRHFEKEMQKASFTNGLLV